MSPSRNENQFSSRNVLMSPGTMMSNLKLSSPIRVPLSPRKMDYNIMSSPGKSTQGGLSLFSQGSPVKSLFSTTNSLKLEKQEAHAYHLAKQSFHTAKPDRIVGREVETETVNQFVRGHVTKKTGGSLYISGAPGTGKTAVLTHILDNVKAAHSCKSVYLNCMTLRDSATVYGKLYTDLTGKSPPSAKDRLRAVEKYLTTTGPSIIMVLDEIDQLDSKIKKYYTRSSKMAIITEIQTSTDWYNNALDLTDRILPRLQARPNCKPQLLNFAPYSKDQIANIIKDRLKKIEEQGLAVMEPSAIQFCARKISAVAGDMRKALDVCRRAVELVEHEVKTQKVLSSPTKRPPAVPKKIGVVQINKVLSEVYGSSSVSNSQDSIPLQQKLIVCTLLLMVKQGKMKEVTMGKEHEVKTQKVLSSPTKIDHQQYQKKIGVVQINKVLSEVYGSSSVSNSQDSIPLQQKLIVCTLLLMVKQGKMKEVTMGKAAHSCKSVYLNCMTLRDSATVYGKLYTDLTGKSPPSAKDRLRAVEKYLTTTGPSIIMVLDEIDQLDSKNQEILYTIFEWPSLQKSRLVLIGIANALDLTDRILPRLQARPNCKPQLLNFAPYSKDQIANIIKDRLKKIEEQGLAVMEPSAIQFCARKISAVAGDMRKALDVCRRAVELRNMNQDSIPLQQKLIVCTLLLMVKQGKMKEVTMGKVHDTYSKICKKRQMATVDYTEYQGICNLLETRGIMGIKKIKDGRLAKIVLKLDERELDHTLQDKILMSSIMKDGLP
ncbi:CDC6 [Mytilus coruscus]|uniref:CDC6 n=1 Tax=Mytilus coruscus TaxID=42192 RepID=A0A6J8E3J3_MYTCO|nr:CDC6 [Mytilus coruscus]